MATQSQNRDTAQGLFDPRSAFVETYDSAGTRVDSDFHVTIFCGDLTGI